VRLEAGQLSQSVEVTAAAPLLQNGKRRGESECRRKKISTLPLDGRNFIPLVTLSPGVALPSGQFLPRINGKAGRALTNTSTTASAYCSRSRPGGLLSDHRRHGGAQAQCQRILSRIRRSNGGTVMVIGKSGSNQFPGSLFEFFRNEALNARNLFAQPGPKPEFRRKSVWLDARRTGPE